MFVNNLGKCVPIFNFFNQLICNKILYALTAKTSITRAICCYTCCYVCCTYLSEIISVIFLWQVI